jgi:hypothetical protein
MNGKRQSVYGVVIGLAVILSNLWRVERKTKTITSRFHNEAGIA